MKVREKLGASASALGLLLVSQSAGALDMIDVGEWKIEFSGNINGFVSDVKCDAGAGVVARGAGLRLGRS